jgi:NDP-sugar pyrophosphorylase family protein
MNNSLAYTGWQILNPKVTNEVKKNVFSLNFCYDNAIKNNSIWGIINSQKWLHIGTIEALKEANTWLENYK